MKYLAALFLAPVLSQATTIFDGYEAYYASLPNRIFQSPGIKLEPYSVLGDDTTRFGWHGMAAGRQQKVEVRDGQLKLNGRPLALQLVKTFPDEVAFFSFRNGRQTSGRVPDQAQGQEARDLEAA
jgi:hypothetical protein